MESVNRAEFPDFFWHCSFRRSFLKKLHVVGVTSMDVLCLSLPTLVELEGR